MTTWKLTLEYDGTRYRGWQEQNNARSVAGELRAAAEKILGGPVEFHGSGRTDAGVHAIAQVAHLRTRTASAAHPNQLLRRLNDELPADIVVTAIEPASPRFHSRHDARSRTYVYQISTRKSAFSKKYVWWVKQPLEVAAMKRAASLVAGRHDFEAFCAADPSKPGQSTLVDVTNAEIEAEDGMITFRIQASHFLWRMVRRLTGALVKVGLGELSEEDFARLLNHGPRNEFDVAAWTAPASGLFLESVEY